MLCLLGHRNKMKWFLLSPREACPLLPKPSPQEPLQLGEKHPRGKFTEAKRVQIIKNKTKQRKQQQTSQRQFYCGAKENDSGTSFFLHITRVSSVSYKCDAHEAMMAPRSEPLLGPPALKAHSPLPGTHSRSWGCVLRDAGGLMSSLSIEVEAQFTGFCPLMIQLCCFSSWCTVDAQLTGPHGDR